MSTFATRLNASIGISSGSQCCGSVQILFIHRKRTNTPTNNRKHTTVTRTRLAQRACICCRFVKPTYPHSTLSDNSTSSNSSGSSRNKSSNIACFDVYTVVYFNHSSSLHTFRYPRLFPIYLLLGTWYCFGIFSQRIYTTHEPNKHLLYRLFIILFVRFVSLGN